MMKKDKSEFHNKDHKRPQPTGVYYSFLTIVLVFCLFQIGYGAILNISKIISYQAKTVTLQNLLKQTKMHKQDLKAEKKMVTSDNSLEGIARNNLKMAKKDEVLIIINKKVEKNNKKYKRHWNLKNLFNFKQKQKSKEEEIKELPYIPQNFDEE